MIWCESEEDAASLFEILDRNGFMWFSREEINPYNQNHWCVYEEDTYYYLSMNNRKIVMFGKVGSNYAKRVRESRKFVYCSQYESFHNPSTEDGRFLLFGGASIVGD